MKKQILSEVNRAREIMGLGKLIMEMNRSYGFEENGELNDAIGWIEGRLEKAGISSLGRIPGYKKLNTLMGKNFKGNGAMGTITAEDVICAYVQQLGGGKLNKRGVKNFVEQIKNGGISVDVESIPVPVTPGGMVLTQGDILTLKDVNIDKTNAREKPSSVCKYTNSYNISSFANDGEQYDISEMGSKSLDFRSGPTGKDGALLLYATKTGAEQGVETDREEKETIEKGYEATGRYQTDYAAGDSNPQSNIVDKAVMEIMQMFPADIAKNIDVFNLQAGASANWGGNKLPNSQGKGNSGFAEGDEGKNQRLAFERGDKFMKAVNQKLKAQGHPGFDNYVVNWVVQGQSKSDQFIDLMLKVDKEDKIKTKTIVTSKVVGDRTERAGKSTVTGLVIYIGVP